MTDAQSYAEQFGLGPVCQLSYAVRSLDEAMPRFGALFGPFEIKTVDLPDITYRDRKTHAVLKVAFGRSGPLQIEVVEVASGDFPQTEFLARYGEGLHHIAYAIDDLASKVALMRANGFDVAVAGAAGPMRFAYVEAPAFLGASMIELMQLPPDFAA
jgi:methylmalonyl-CoA/ethylmalonyl-CoA epimerase